MPRSSVSRRPIAAGALVGSAAGALALGALAVGAAPARAQLPGVPGVNPFSFGVEAGPAFPVGAFGRAFNAGFTADALLEARLPVLPVGLRVEGGYARFGGKVGVLAARRVVSGSANVVLRSSPVATSLVRSYLIGGVGIYGQNGGVGTAAGLNVGGGVSVPLALVTAFGDARYTHVFNRGITANFIPLRVGVRF